MSGVCSIVGCGRYVALARCERYVKFEGCVGLEESERRTRSTQCVRHAAHEESLGRCVSRKS